MPVQALCVALAVAWVAAVNIGTANAAEHALAIPHDHGAKAAMAGMLSDGAQGHHSDHGIDHDDDGGAKAPDHPAGAGHHHADAPTGVPVAVAAVGPAQAFGDGVLAIADDRSVTELVPGGLKRPPRTSDIVV